MTKIKLGCKYVMLLPAVMSKIKILPTSMRHLDLHLEIMFNENKFWWARLVANIQNNIQSCFQFVSCL